MRNRTSFLGALVLGVFVISFSSSTHANQAAAYRKYKGQIVVSEEEIPGSFSSDKEMLNVLKRVNRQVVSRKEGSESWTLYCMGFMNKKPGVSMINLVFYRLTGGKREYVTNKEIGIDGESLVVVTTVDVSDEDGVKPGEKYEVALARMVDGKETIFAKTKLTFK
ncbi:MAG: hypothetical protein HY698_05275 [Deltaproteobacteria bacterium]|nr:hypothetical protein [Deltaproteobacteria bacterium]